MQSLLRFREPVKEKLYEFQAHRNCKQAQDGRGLVLGLCLFTLFVGSSLFAINLWAIPYKYQPYHGNLWAQDSNF